MYVITVKKKKILIQFFKTEISYFMFETIKYKQGHMVFCISKLDYSAGGCKFKNNIFEKYMTLSID